MDLDETVVLRADWSEAQRAWILAKHRGAPAEEVEALRQKFDLVNHLADKLKKYKEAFCDGTIVTKE